MSIRILQRFLITAAALLTVLTGLADVSYGKDGPLAILIAETVEDAEEEGDREDLLVLMEEPIREMALHVSTFWVREIEFDLPIVCGPHNLRGPPLG